MKKIFNRIKVGFTRGMTYQIDYNGLLNIKKSNQNTWIIDVRTKDEYSERHLTDAINIPLHELDGNIEKVVTNKNDIVICYCQSGSRSEKACIKMKSLGYINVYNLKKGIAGIV